MIRQFVIVSENQAISEPMSERAAHAEIRLLSQHGEFGELSVEPAEKYLEPEAETLNKSLKAQGRCLECWGRPSDDLHDGPGLGHHEFKEAA